MKFPLYFKLAFITHTIKIFFNYFFPFLNITLHVSPSANDYHTSEKICSSKTFGGIKKKVIFFLTRKKKVFQHIYSTSGVTQLK